MQSGSDTRGRRIVGTASTVVFSLVMTASALLFLSGAPKVGASLGALLGMWAER